MKLPIFLCLCALSFYAVGAENRVQGVSGFQHSTAANLLSVEDDSHTASVSLLKSRLDRLQLAAANTDTIPVSTLPATITAPGTYVLQQDLILDTTLFYQAVSIRSGNVILDCQGRRITASHPGSGIDGVLVASGLADVTVMNCILEGFGFGIRGGSAGTGMQVLNNELRGGGDIGIYLAGNNTHVVGNRIVAQRYTSPENTSGIGIMISSFDGTGSQPSSGALVQDNFIVGLKGGEQAIGIQIVGSTGAQVLGNKVLDISADNPGAYAYAIFLRASYRWPKPPGLDVLTSGTIIRNNELMLRQLPLNTFAYATDGIALDAVECVGNLSIGFAKAFDRCLAASNNIELGTLHPTAVNGSQPLLKLQGSQMSAAMPLISEGASEKVPELDSRAYPAYVPAAVEPENN